MVAEYGFCTLLARSACPNCGEASKVAAAPLLSSRRGGCAIKKKLRSDLSSRRRGGVAKNCLITPPRPLLSTEASRLFLDVAATSPAAQEGSSRLIIGMYVTHAAARLSASMSIFTIFIKACVTFFTFSGSLSCMSWPRTVGTICHDKPYLSVSHPH